MMVYSTPSRHQKSQYGNQQQQPVEVLMFIGKLLAIVILRLANPLESLAVQT